jgi:hypothetical protein
MGRCQLNAIQERLFLLTAALNPEILLLQKGMMLCAMDQRPVTPTVEMNNRFLSVVMLGGISYRLVEPHAAEKSRGHLARWEIAFPRARRARLLLLSWADTLRYPSSENDVLLGETLERWLDGEERQAKRSTPMAFRFDESNESAVRQTLNLLVKAETPMTEHKSSFQGPAVHLPRIIYETSARFG